MTSQSTRQAFGEALVDLGERYPDIVVLDADLSKSTRSDLFAQRFPTRFFQMGIAEANMIGVAAGLSFTGYLPFLCSFGCFLTGRYDTIRLSAAYNQANIRLVGTHSGVGVGEDGYSQMGLEDLALMRSLPGMGVFQPMDAYETRAILEFLVREWKGPAYLRLTRQNLPTFKELSFIPKKMSPCYQPSHPQILCISTGSCVAEALRAAPLLQNHGIALEVWNAHCLKPFDHETLFQRIATQTFTHILTWEDHSILGGLGSCVAELLATLSRHPPLIRLGIPDCFGESGTTEELYHHFGISAETVIQKIINLPKADT